MKEEGVENGVGLLDGEFFFLYISVWDALFGMVH